MTGSDFDWMVSNHAVWGWKAPVKTSVSGVSLLQLSLFFASIRPLFPRNAWYSGYYKISLASFPCRLLVRLGHLTYCSERPILKDCWNFTMSCRPGRAASQQITLLKSYTGIVWTAGVYFTSGRVISKYNSVGFIAIFNFKGRGRLRGRGELKV